MDKKQLRILDVLIDSVNLQQALDKVVFFLQSNRVNYIVTPNPEIILIAQKDNELKDILNKADLSLPDGFGLTLASKFQIKKRVTGTDLMREIIKNYPDKKYKFILNGKGLSTKEDIYKKIKVPIDERNPDIIFVGLGCPGQEKWIKENIKNYPSAKILMAVGGGIDFLTNRQKRAPEFMQKIGLEWLWRLLTNPRIFFKAFTAFPLFPLLVAKEKLKMVE